MDWRDAKEGILRAQAAANMHPLPTPAEQVERIARLRDMVKRGEIPEELAHAETMRLLDEEMR